MATSRSQRPCVCACIDIGSNTTRLLVAEAGTARPARGAAAARVHAHRHAAWRRTGDPARDDRRGRRRRRRAGRARRGRRARRVDARRRHGGDPRRAATATTCSPRCGASGGRRGAGARRRRGGAAGVRRRHAHARRDRPAGAGRGRRRRRRLDRDRGRDARGGRARGRRSLPVGSGSLADHHLRGDPPAAGRARRPARARGAARRGPRAAAPSSVALAVGGSATSLRRLVGAVLDPRGARARAARAAAGARRATSVAAALGLRRRARAAAARRASWCSSGGRRRLGTPLQIARGGLREGVILELGDGERLNARWRRPTDIDGSARASRTPRAAARIVRRARARAVRRTPTSVLDTERHRARARHARRHAPAARRARDLRAVLPDARATSRSCATSRRWPTRSASGATPTSSIAPCEAFAARLAPNAGLERCDDCAPSRPRQRVLPPRSTRSAATLASRLRALASEPRGGGGVERRRAAATTAASRRPPRRSAPIVATDARARERVKARARQGPRPGARRWPTTSAHRRACGSTSCARFMPRAADPREVVALHDMRIAAKRLRYVLELTGAVLRRRTRERAAAADQGAAGPARRDPRLRRAAPAQVRGVPRGARRPQDAAALVARARRDADDLDPRCAATRRTPRLGAACSAARAPARPPATCSSSASSSCGASSSARASARGWSTPSPSVPSDIGAERGYAVQVP